MALTRLAPRQMRIFEREILPRYPQIKQSADTAALTPTLIFYDAGGDELEQLEVSGMFAEEVEEELNSRGVLPRSA